MVNKHICTKRAHMKKSCILYTYCFCNAFLMENNADFALRCENTLLWK